MPEERISPAVLGVGSALGFVAAFLAILCALRVRAAPRFPGGDFYTLEELMVVKEMPYPAVYPIGDFLRPADVNFLYEQCVAPTDKETVYNCFWNVLRNVNHVPDVGEYWRFPLETWNDKEGDCEDQAFLLASLLLNRFTEVYGVIGRWDIHGHAWVVLRHQGVNYLFESISSYPPDPWATVEEVADFYHPYIYFNKDVIWVKPGWENLIYFVRGVDAAADERRKKEAIDEYWRKRSQQLKPSPLTMYPSKPALAKRYRSQSHQEEGECNREEVYPQA